MKKLTKISPIITHLIPWVIIIIGPIIKVLLHPEAESDHRLFALLVMALHIIGYYTNQALLVPSLLFKRKLALYGISLASLIGLVFVITTVTNIILFGASDVQ